MKKLLSILIVLAMALTMMSAAALAADGLTIDVKSQDELIAALNKTEKVSYINIVQSFTITKDCTTNLDAAHLEYYALSSVTVKEGVTLTIGSGGRFGAAWFTYEGDWEHGTIPCAVVYNEGTVIVKNGGATEGEFTGNTGTIIVERGGEAVVCSTNSGTVTVKSGGKYMTTQGGQATNSGTITVAKGGELRSRFGTNLINNGTIELNGDFYVGCANYDGADHCWFENHGTVTGTGRVILVHADEEHPTADLNALASTVMAQLGESGYRIGVQAGAGDPAYQEGWHENETGRWYQNADGTCPKAQWQQIGKDWYRFNKAGYMMTGWVKVGEKAYYLGDDGVMKTGWQEIGGKWYWFDSSGAMVKGLRQIGKYTYLFAGDGPMKTGWQKVGESWYYFQSSGAMKTGWMKTGGVYYYFGTDGVMKTGWQKVGKAWYYLGTDGAMKTGWQQIGGKWYYFLDSGAMATGWQKLGGDWYYFLSGGPMATGWQKIGGSWYYFKASGVMQTGWMQSGSTWYYFKPSGVMAANETIGRYTFDASGAWVK